jgi:hypothetical protein
VKGDPQVTSQAGPRGTGSGVDRYNVGYMLNRFLKLIANNPLAATIVGTVIGGWLLTLLLAMKAPDVGGLIGTAGRWLRTQTTTTNGDIITLAVISILLGFLCFAAMLFGQFQKLQRRGAEQRADVPQAPGRFEPEAYELTPLRSRALLALLGRVEARTTLYDLHQAVQEYDYDGRHYIDESQSRGRLQHDMDEAEHVGIVSIERRPNGTSHYYGMTVPGRDWVLHNESVLKAMAPDGMTQKERLRYR